MVSLDDLGKVTDATRSRATELAAEFPTVSTMWGYKAGGSEHGVGRALDLMLYTHGGARIDTALGDRIAGYLWTHRDRLDLTHIIWRQRIKSTVKSPGRWRPMEDRGDATKNHEDHVHVFFGTAPYRPNPDTPGDIMPTPSEFWSHPLEAPGVAARATAGAHLLNANAKAGRAMHAADEAVARVGALEAVVAQIAARGTYLTPEQITDAARAGAGAALDARIAEASVDLIVESPNTEESNA